MKKIVKNFFLLLFVISIAISAGKVMAEETNKKLAAPEYLHVYRNSETSLKIEWKRVRNADGYVVYRYDAKSRKYQKLKIKKGNQKNQIIDRGLKTNKVYRYQVKAYKKVNGKRRYGEESYYAEAKPYQRKAKVINAGKISSDKKVTLGITMSEKMDTYVKPSKYGKNKKKKALTQKLRWRSSNEEIATVTPEGKIIAGIKEGKCTIYAIAHNGNRRKIKVTVLNYAYPENFDGYKGWEPLMNELFGNYKSEICNIASYFTINRPSTYITIQLNNEGDIVCDPSNLELGAIQSDVNRLLKEFPVDIKIKVNGLRVKFIMERYDESGAMTFRCYVEYYYGNEYKQFGGIIAEHWRSSRFIPVG